MSPQPLRILMASRGVLPVAPGCGGAEMVAYQLARSLAAEGHRVTLLSDVGARGAVDAPGLEVLPIDSAAVRLVRRLPGFISWLALHLVGNIVAARAVRRLVRVRRFDVVHAHGSLSAILASWRSRVPVIYTEHDAPPWICRYRRWWERGLRSLVYRVLNVTAFRRADRVAALFGTLRDDIVGRWRVAGENVRTIGNGTEVSQLEEDRGERVAVPFDRFCLFVGRLTSRKAPDLLIRAVAEVEGLCCAVAGDGPMREKLERLAERLGVSDRIVFLGNVASRDLPGLYARADLLVLPSVSEAFPLVALEAMACGTPVLATRVAGLRTLVSDWETGFLVKPGDLGELATAMRFLLRDDALRLAMSERARIRVREHFSWPVVAGEYEQLYRSLLTPEPPVRALAAA